MCDRLFDQLELGSRVAQSLVAENDLSPIARQAAVCWRATANSVKAATGVAPESRPAEAVSTFACAA